MLIRFMLTILRFMLTILFSAIVALFLSILLAPSSQAATQLSWKSIISNAAASTQTSTGSGLGDWQVASAGNVYYVKEVGGSGTNDYSEVLNISACNGSMLSFFQNTADKTADNKATGLVYYCSSGNPSTTACYAVSADINDTSVGIDNYSLTGDPGNEAVDYDSNGNDNRGWIEDISFPLIFVRWATDPSVNITSQFQFDCKR